jgi:hypothetical protein
MRKLHRSLAVGAFAVPLALGASGVALAAPAAPWSCPSRTQRAATSRSRAPSAAGADRARAGTVTRHARRGAGRRPGEDVSPGTGPASRLDEASGGAARVGQEDRRLRAAPC